MRKVGCYTASEIISQFTSMYWKQFPLIYHLIFLQSATCNQQHILLGLPKWQTEQTLKIPASNKHTQWATKRNRHLLFNFRAIFMRIPHVLWKWNKKKRKKSYRPGIPKRIERRKLKKGGEFFWKKKNYEGGSIKTKIKRRRNDCERRANIRDIKLRKCKWRYICETVKTLRNIFKKL